MARYLVFLLLPFVAVAQHRVAPGVPPQAYQAPTGMHAQQPPHHVQQQQFQQVPVQHHVPGVPPQQHIPPPQQHIPPPQQQFQQQQHHQQIPQQQQFQQQQQQHVPVQHVQHQQQVQQVGHGGGHHDHHAAGQPQNLLDASNVLNERSHIQEHMDLPIDTSQMTEQELQFHYFKMHDADNNNKLDGCELVKSLIHWHDGANHNPNSGHAIPEPKIFKDEELIQMIDPILQNDDLNKDGTIDYSEFSRAQTRAAAAAGAGTH